MSEHQPPDSAVPRRTVRAVDRRWSRLLASRRTARLDALALGFNNAGRGVGRAAILGAIGVELARRRRWGDLAGFALAEAGTPAAVNLLKLLVSRRRPEQAEIGSFGTSFPSGHTAFAAATGVALVLLDEELDPAARRAAWVAAGAGTLGMAWSRTYLQLHWLTDVAAGGLLGTGVTLVAFDRVRRSKRSGGAYG